MAISLILIQSQIKWSLHDFAHNSSVVVACANIGSDLMASNRIMAKQIFIDFELRCPRAPFTDILTFIVDK